jgi:hypothetical protein
VFGRLAFFDRDHAVFAYSLESFSQKVSDRHVVVRRDRANVGDFIDGD